MKVREALVRDEIIHYGIIMKSYKHLFEKAISDVIMDEALNDAADGKSNRPEVQEILCNRDKYKHILRQKILSGEYVPCVHKAEVREDGYTHKKRVIVKPFFDKENQEQWIHHIVIKTIMPILTKGMYVYTCGSIPGRGIHYGKRYLSKFIRNNPAEIKYVLKFDIRHFYENINTELLKERFKKIIHDKRMLDLIFYIIDSNEYVLNGRHEKDGVIIGFYTSQWFANFFLQPFDHFIKEELKSKCYVRYMDDCVIFGKNKKELHKKLELIKEYLSELDLELKSNYQIFRFDYISKKDGKRHGRFIDFMGFKFYRDKTTIRKGIFARAVKTAIRIGKKSKITWFDAARMLSYKGWFKHTDTREAFRKYISSRVNFKVLRKIMSNHSKKRRGEKV